MIKFAFGGSGCVNPGTGFFCQIHVAGDEIGMKMGFQDMSNGNSKLASLIDIYIHVSSGVDNRASFFTGKYVGTVGDFRKKKVFD
jgi:hypothetical protein